MLANVFTDITVIITNFICEIQDFPKTAVLNNYRKGDADHWSHSEIQTIMK